MLDPLKSCSMSITTILCFSHLLACKFEILAKKSSDDQLSRIYKRLTAELKALIGIILSWQRSLRETGGGRLFNFTKFLAM